MSGTQSAFFTNRYIQSGFQRGNGGHAACNPAADDQQIGVDCLPLAAHPAASCR